MVVPDLYLVKGKHTYMYVHVMCTYVCKIQKNILQYALSIKFLLILTFDFVFNNNMYYNIKNSKSLKIIRIQFKSLTGNKIFPLRFNYFQIQ